MVQYLLTGLAGIVLGIVAMRVWQAREPGAGSSEQAQPATSAPTAAAAAGGIGSRKLLLGAGGLAVAAIAIIGWHSANTGTETSLAVPQSGVNGTKSLDDVDTMINRLSARLEKEPNDGEGFRMLGWSYVMTSRPDQAINPYKRALALLPGSALVHSGYGEALTGVAKGTVTPEAKAEFERAVAIEPTEPRARYFLALWQAQNGEEKQALEKWIALANSGPADAPWQQDLRRQITTTSAKLGVDVSARLKAPAPAAGVPAPTQAQVQAINALPADQRQATVDSMVEGLAAKLAADPKNADRWVMLLRSRMVLKQANRAGKDLATARKALAADAAALAKINAAASELGVPGA